MNTKTTQGVPYPPAERLINAIKKMCARVLYHRATSTLLGDAAADAENELFESLAAMLDLDRTDLFHEIGAMAQDIQCDLIAKEKDAISADLALIAGLNKELDRLVENMPKRSLISVTPTIL